ncbi:MAG: ribonucleoside-diphosphate reductase subunit alpha [Verrucomicrobia bacterium CG_4_10_14_3_um_filter_43_23]|nr:MAG: ribonucleoside-diphosphate reductase subunit alpha [Verrucomicrobia bacterium CG1_02_43_26]PIP58562.1 MAG: ribonucleoside-diphosphate reductase subunit alpha [Verrucomicrobia bacterium CG22_combo_CG10-13_8_21_14_all_43_17]PIX58279.1 MAG: ribonucleoside-diphosphate reductase subunit alpha [Verrucomicrobia bacterium CG_4_10_14_3_um_filter_43_23]PIY60789.1 MAG: ribonucleoside-diphosphate reductase subunit alpha [Verrucomicrobia bacterium CG_4_10_14_0_8_um_filter_43_34]PJA43542.1 MAG: ribon
MRKISFDEELALKRFAYMPADQKPRFDWQTIIDNEMDYPGITIKDDNEHRDFNLNELADMIGEALTDLFLSREDEDIYNDANREFVTNVVNEVVEYIGAQIKQEGKSAFSTEDIYLFVEKILIQRNAHDVAKSLVLKRAKFFSNKERKHNQPKGMEQLRLIRRNGQVVPWNQNKIEVAIRKAFLSLHQDSETAVEIGNVVTERVKELGQAFVHIEDVQDIVQETLMRMGFYKIAENYILYRAYRSHVRTAEAEEAETQADARQESLIMVKDEETGDTYFWDSADLRKRIDFAIIGLDLQMDNEDIEAELRRSLYPEMNAKDLKKTIILNAKSLIEKDADFAKFAGRILLSYIYEEVLGWSIMKDGVESLKSFHRRGFKDYVKHGVKIGRLSKKLLKYDLDQLSEALDYSADLDFDYLGVQTLYDRYLIIDKTQTRQRRIETPQFFWMRVSMGLFIEEKKDKEDWAIRLYQLYKSRRFCSSTPTLFNSGTNHSQLSSCYLYKVDDSIESIMIRGIAENAYLSKWAGGLGGSWTAVRGTGSYIQGTNGESQGVIPFLKLHNDQLVAVNQGGKRRGSGVAYLEPWHNDFYDFLELRRNTGDDRRRTHDMNTANWIPDLFMKRMEAREDWTLFRSNETPELHELYGKAFEEKYAEYEKLAEAGKIQGEKVPAIELWKKMLAMLFETGHPWITFKDPCNIRSPQDHVGVIHSSNLCTEITLNTSHEETAVCNLGSVILESHVNEKGELDHKKLRETIQVAIRALDNVIDINFYPTEAARCSNTRHRPIGLGVMGLQNALYKRGISFASPEAVEFNDEFMEAIAYYAIEASSDLAKENGKYSSYKGSKWDRGLLPQDTIDLLEAERGMKIDTPRGGRMDWKPLREKIAAQGMRNSNVMAIAPTATISNIMGTTPCIEPAYKNLYVKSNLSGDFIVLNSYLVKDLKAIGLWNDSMVEQLKYFDGELADITDIPDEIKARYLTAFAVDYKYFIEAAARRQKWIDQAQSVNLFLPQASLKTLSHMYRMAWHAGLKTTYYLRTMGASNIEKATVNRKKETRGLIGQSEEEVLKKEYTETERQACSLEAMMNGGTCEACQ